MMQKISRFIEKFLFLYFSIPIILLLYLISLLIDNHWGIFHFKIALLYAISILIPLFFLYFAIFKKENWKMSLFMIIIPISIGMLLFYYTSSFEYLPFNDLSKDEIRFENHQMLKPRRY